MKQIENGFIFSIRIYCKVTKAATNMRFYASAAGGWSNQQQSFILLLFGLEVLFSAEVFILNVETKINFGQPGGSNAIAAPA